MREVVHRHHSPERVPLLPERVPLLPERVPLHHSPVRVPLHHSPVREVIHRHHSPCHSRSPVREVVHVHHSPARPHTSPIRCSPVREFSPMKPVLHPHEEAALVQGVKDFGTQEEELENSKIALTMKPDFNLHDTFTIFDHFRNGSICQADLREGLAAIGVFPTADEVNLFFQRYDLNKNHRLNFSEFSAAFVCYD